MAVPPKAKAPAISPNFGIERLGDMSRRVFRFVSRRVPALTMSPFGLIDFPAVCCGLALRVVAGRTRLRVY